MLGEVKAGMAAEGGPEDEAPADRWCRLLLIAHLDAPHVGVVTRVMLNVATAEVCLQSEPAPDVCSQRTPLPLTEYSLPTFVCFVCLFVCW